MLIFLVIREKIAKNIKNVQLILEVPSCQRKKAGQIIAMILIALGIIVSIYSAWQRVDIERSHKQTSLLLDFSQVEEACAVENISLSEGLSRFAPYATGVVIKEPTILDLENNNKLVVRSGVELVSEPGDWLISQGVAGEINAAYNYLFFTQKVDMERVKKHILAKVPGAVADIVSDSRYILATSLPASAFGGLGTGFFPG